MANANMLAIGFIYLCEIKLKTMKKYKNIEKN